MVILISVCLVGCNQATDMKNNFFNQFEEIEPEESIIFWDNEQRIKEFEDRKTIEDDFGQQSRNDFYVEDNLGYQSDHSSTPSYSYEEVEQEQEQKEERNGTSSTFDIAAYYDQLFQDFLASEDNAGNESNDSGDDYNILEFNEEETTELSTEKVTEISTEQELAQVEEPTTVVQQTPVFILDSDMCSDVDDMFALSMMLGYDRQGLIDLQGVSLCSSRVRTVYAASALMHASKVYDIPIALHVETGIDLHSDYINEISNWPHSEQYVGDNLQLYHEIFAKVPGKVNILCTGQLIQLSRLLNQPGGAELIAQKVDKLYFVGTKYNGKAENNLFFGADKYNGKMGDISKQVIANWPTEIVFIPADSGGLMQCGQFLNTSDRNKTDILSQAKGYFAGGVYGVTAFDPFGAFAAVMDCLSYNEVHGLSYERGYMETYSGGGCYWQSIPDGPHRRIILGNDNSYYQSQMNLILGEEFKIRTGKEVVW